MSIVRPITDQAAFEQWVAERPQCIQDMIRSHPPDRLYRLDGDKRVTLHSYQEDGTVVVNVTGEYNRVLFSRQVFGVKLADLVECDLPEEGEDVGDTSQEAGYTQDDVREILIPKIREEMQSKTVANGAQSSESQLGE